MIDLAESGLPGRSILRSQGSHWRKINSTQWGICYYYSYLISIIFEYYHLLFFCLIDVISLLSVQAFEEEKSSFLQLQMSHLMCVHGPLMEVEDEDCADHAARHHNLGWLVVQLL